LRNLGGVFDLKSGEVRIKGPQDLHGGEVTAPDLRGGAALMLAALTAEGETVIRDFNIIRRGYDDLPEKFSAMNIEFEIKD
jgi:UDP-N-acetylglucosamine 1-carboxyvinyltransferase